MIQVNNVLIIGIVLLGLTILFLVGAIWFSAYAAYKYEKRLQERSLEEAIRRAEKEQQKEEGIM